jgi:stage III sporulation protein AF
VKVLVKTVTEWARDLVVISLAFAFTEMLLPANDLRRFARVVMGIVMIAVIVSFVLDISGTLDDALESQAGFALDQTGMSDTQNWIAKGELVTYRGLEIAGAETGQKLSRQLESVARLASGADEAHAVIEFTQRGDIRSIRVTLKNLGISVPSALRDDNSDSGTHALPDRKENAKIIEERVINAIRDFYGFSRNVAISVSVGPE